MIEQADHHPRIALIVAVGRNGVIGADGDLPWRLKDDMKHFVDTTRGKPVIMGRKTWESFPRRPLPGRANLVVTRDYDYSAMGAHVFASLGVALASGRCIARMGGFDELMVIGGGAVYAATLPMADVLYLTEVDAEPEGDAVFPALDANEWVETFREHHPADDKNDHAFTIRRLERAA